MRSVSLDRLQRLVEPLTRFFYALMGVALLSVFLGAPDSALFFLIVGAAAYVFRASIQEVAWQRETRATPTPRRPPRAVPATATGSRAGGSERPRRPVRAGQDAQPGFARPG